MRNAPNAPDTSGAVSVTVALLLVVLIGFVSLGVEIVLLLAASRSMQSAADAAALAAVTAKAKGAPADYTQEAFSMTAAAGFTNGQGNTTVTVNNPPATGNFTSANDAIEILIAQPQAPPLANVVYSGGFTLHARAVARLSGNGACVLTLETATTGYSEAGTVGANFVNCDLAVNSTSSQAVSLTGGSLMSANRVIIAGGYSLSGGSQITATNGITTNAPAFVDPYASYTIPTPGGCTYNKYSALNGATLSPGTYCNGLSVGGGASVTLSPGIYIIDRGQFNLSGGSSATGSGVTIVLTSRTGSGYATVSISGSSRLTLSAPTSGATAGLVFFQDRRAPSSGTDDLSGGSQLTLSGGLYFPNQGVKYNGGTGAVSQCTQIVARSLTMTGNTTLQVDCTGTGVKPIGGSATLVE